MWRRLSASIDLKSDYEIGSKDKLASKFQEQFLKSIFFSSAAHFFHQVETKSQEMSGRFVR